MTQSISVTFVSPESEAGQEMVSPETTPIPYDLQVKNYCTDGEVPGVTVYLDGAEIGQTDADGMISLGALMPGSTHTLKMIKDGYINSDKDHIDNASFTVPAS